jgi:hypothetical protein
MPLIVGLLLFFGVQLWFVIMHGVGIRRYQTTLIAIAAIIAAIRPAARKITFLLDRIRRPTQRTISIAGVCIFIIAAGFLYFQAATQHRDFGLRYQDEYSYRIQSQMVAQGELWKPAHPLAEFFETFQLIATPVYASIYFPGTAILSAPGVWLDWPKWVVPLLTSAGVIALVYCVFTVLIDGIAGAIGALLVGSIPMFREHSIMLMSQTPAMFFSLLLIWVWLRWREHRGIWLAGIAGGIAAWLAMTRPVDALTAIVPVCIGVFIDLRGETWPRRGAILLAALIGAAPFLAIQIAFNYRVTGSVIETPFEFYTRQVYPRGSYGFHGNIATTRPSWDLPQIQQAYRQLTSGFLHDHTPAQAFFMWRTKYFPDMIELLCAHRLLVILLPVGLVGLRGRRWVVFAIFPLFVLFYFPYLFFLEHYVLIVIPAIVMLMALGVEALADCSTLMRPHVLTFLALSILGLTISGWPLFDRVVSDDVPYWADSLREIDVKLSNLPHRPAIVLFRFSLKNSVDLEPVYNADVAWPDDAQVIRAHDRGEQNIELYRYYAQRQPDRWIYLFDRNDGSLTELGQAKQLGQSLR